jgi:DNA-binding NarL/FixJ family response regulator
VIRVLIRVLVVEDEPLIAEAHQLYLSRVGGFEVAGVVGTAREAVRRVTGAITEGRPIDLVLLDIGCPTTAASSSPRPCPGSAPPRTSSRSPANVTWRWSGRPSPTAC